MAMDNLDQLRDIHLPDAITWWPLAPGWYVLLIIIFVLGVWQGWRYYQHRINKHPIKTALEYLDDLQIRYDVTKDAVTTVTEISILLRRTSLLHFSRAEVASLHDKTWLEFLDKAGNTSQFSHGIGQLLITVPYKKEFNCNPEDIQQLFILVRDWIKAV